MTATLGRRSSNNVLAVFSDEPSYELLKAGSQSGFFLDIIWTVVIACPENPAGSIPAESRCEVTGNGEDLQGPTVEARRPAPQMAYCGQPRGAWEVHDIYEARQTARGEAGAQAVQRASKA